MRSPFAIAFLFGVLLSVPPSVSCAETPTPGDSRKEWKFTGQRTLGERTVSVGFQVLGPRPVLVVRLSPKAEDNAPIPIGRLKVTALDNKGKPLAVTKHYDHGMLLVGREYHTAFFQVGTFVQNVQPKDVGSVNIAGFGSKFTVRFLDGDAQDEPDNK